MRRSATAGFWKLNRNTPHALHRLGQLLAAKSDFAAAKTAVPDPDDGSARRRQGVAVSGPGLRKPRPAREASRHHLEFMRLQPICPDGFVAVARCMVKLGRMAEVNAALLAAIEPASAPVPVRISGAIGGPRRTGRARQRATRSA